MIKVDLNEAKLNYLPGEIIEGLARWDLESKPERIEASFFYYTEGKGTQDIVIVERRYLNASSSSGSERFGFNCPLFPYSFDGVLISLRYALELSVIPSLEFVRLELVVGPKASSVRLPETVKDDSKYRPGKIQSNKLWPFRREK